MFPCTASETEKELVRNLFWLVFSMERVFCAGTVWPLTLQDDDTTQYLPLSTTTLAHKFIHYSERQRLSTPRVLVIHPPSITDSFTLYIKSTILLGKVKTFNGRFKNKFDEGMPEGLDPRETAEFQMLDNAITSFKLSFPKEYREPVTAEGKLDPTLYLALVLPHVAMLLLHDPHARPESPNCLSAERMLTSARAILDLIYKLTATSFDLLLLDHSCSFCWFVCATALIRFLKAKMIAGDEVETTRLTNEIQVVRFMLSNLGSRTIVGRKSSASDNSVAIVTDVVNKVRQNIILDEMYQAEVQPLIDKVVGVSNMGGGASGMFGVF
ncbi:hypothetical protein FRB99_001396 [Tulasnella sp. 403]|nr:hypothetical protein FRB99_001396 [Tulasnella sp. 403]